MPPDPAPLFDHSVAYWRSSVLFTALELDLFTHLGAGAPLAELATQLAVPERGLGMLVESLVALDLLDHDGDILRPSTLAEHYLQSGSPSYLGDTILFNARSYAAWGDLTAAVRHNRPAMSTTHFLGDDPQATRNFVHAMHHRALGVARCLVDMIDLADCATLLDLGGGPATYSALLAERFPNLHATVVDLPGILAVSADLLAASPARERVSLSPGDIFADETYFDTPHDAVLISGVLHRTEGQATIDFLRKVAPAVRPGGILAISDLFTGGDTNGPVLPELFSLHMMLTAEQGQSLPLPVFGDILDAAGFALESVQPYPSPLPQTLVLARRLVT
ncbi:MAG: SAM-dependent methyltransferase [Rhodothermales bacterium]|jgi:SAM-dependent methyltransferase